MTDLAKFGPGGNWMETKLRNDFLARIFVTKNLMCIKVDLLSKPPVSVWSMVDANSI